MCVLLWSICGWVALLVDVGFSTASAVLGPQGEPGDGDEADPFGKWAAVLAEHAGHPGGWAARDPSSGMGQPVAPAPRFGPGDAEHEGGQVVLGEQRPDTHRSAVLVADPELESGVVKDSGVAQCARRGVRKLEERVALDGHSFPVGETGQVGDLSDVATLDIGDADQGGRWSNQQWGMALDVPTPIGQIRRGPHAPDVDRTAAVGGKGGDPVERLGVVAPKRPKQRDRVEVSAGHAMVGGTERRRPQASTIGSCREGVIRLRHLEQKAPCDRVPGVEVGFPALGEGGFGCGHATTLDHGCCTDVAAALHPTCTRPGP